MERTQLIIYGIGRFAEYAAYVFENDSHYDVIGFCIENDLLKKIKSSKQRKIIPFEEVDKLYSPNNISIFIAVGNNLVRKNIYQITKDKGFNHASYISSKATSWPNLVVGENTFISEGNIIQPFSTIGNNSILFNNQIGHHCSIGNHTLISVCILGGNVKVCDMSYIGMGSVVKQNTMVEEKNIIGMGCIIDKDTKPGSVFTTNSTIQRSVTFDKVAHMFLK